MCCVFLKNMKHTLDKPSQLRYNIRMSDPLTELPQDTGIVKDVKKHQRDNLPHCDHCDEPTSWLIEVEVPGTLREELLCEDCLDRSNDAEAADFHLQDEF
jgi:hypothetical protein